MKYLMPSRKRSKFKIAVVGTINRDTIYSPKEKKIESYGGILYNLKYLCQNDSFQVYPIVDIGYDCYRRIFSILNSFPNLDLTHIKKVGHKNSHCFLHYTDQASKKEFLTGGVPPLTYCRLQPALEYDLMLVNFVSGRDVKLAALERFRREYGKIIYMDIHSLTLGSRKAKIGVRRYLRRPRYWSRYVDCTDILQLNRIEFEVVSGLPFSPTNALDFFTNHLRRSRCLIVTLGEMGSFVVFEKKDLRCRLIAATDGRRVYDTTGCGDVFAAGFVTEFLKSHNYIEAVARGNLMAAERCRKRGAIF